MPQENTSDHISVSVHAARVVYDGKPLFDDLDLTLPGGCWTSLLGPSGVGKTTLLRLVAGLGQNEPETSVRCSDGRPLAGRIAYMAQQDLLLPWLTVVDNVLIGAALRGERSPDARDRADALIAQVGLDTRRRALPAELSGGQRQRVALARTLFEDRPVVVMDEPFSALDALTRLRIQDLAARLLRGRTVLLVTHDPLEALRLSDKIWVMTGMPATLVPVSVPAGAPPRPVDNTDVLGAQAELLNRFDPQGLAAA